MKDLFSQYKESLRSKKNKLLTGAGASALAITASSVFFHPIPWQQWLLGIGIGLVAIHLAKDKYDELTNLPNRDAMRRHLQAAIRKTQEKSQYGFILMFLDFDHFKRINNNHGHLVGDELLRQIAVRLRTSLCTPNDCPNCPSSRKATELASCRPNGIVGRIGGDDFALLIESNQMDRGCVEVVATRVLQAVSAPYALSPDVTAKSTASIGIVTSWNSVGADADAILRDAETAMYESKRVGRAGFTIFNAGMQERASRLYTLGNELDKALTNSRAEKEAKALGVARLGIGKGNGITTAYQPIVDLRTGRICGTEVLARWDHIVLGSIAPTEFIPIAEETGMIEEVWQYIFQTSCADLKAWQSRFGARAPAQLCVNLSRAQISNQGLPKQIMSVLNAYGLSPHALDIEITESMAGDDVQIRDMLIKLRNLGVSVSLDDFGTGHSSLSFLEQMPVDTIKLDRSFITDCENSDFKKQLIRSTVQIASVKGMMVLAEGIETQSQADLMRALKCDRGQGYLFGRPMSAARMSEYLASRPIVSLAA